MIKSNNTFIKINRSIKSKKLPFCIWGVGYIGLSTAGFFSKKKKCIGFDIDKKLIKNLNKGNVKDDDFKKWLGFSIKPRVKKNKLVFFNSVKELKRFRPLVHFICIPTEKNGIPNNEILEKVIKQIKNNFNEALIIIESTLTPGTAEKMVKKHLINFLKRKKYFLSVAPRRDWFVDNSKNLADMDRVFGGWSKQCTYLTKKVLSIVCKRLHQASSYKISELVKSFENSYRHVDIAMANQLSLAFPHLDVREALKLVGTKWNIGTFYPGFGSGGYCIPVSSKYILTGSKKRNKLSILKEAVKIDNSINTLIAKSIIKRKIKNVGIFGLSYKENLKVFALSPIIPFVKYLKKNGVKCSLFDPYYSKREIKKIINISSFNFSDVSKFDCIVYHVEHSKFLLNKSKILKNIKCKFFLDNTSSFSNKKDFFKSKKIEYKSTGNSNWI